MVRRSRAGRNTPRIVAAFFIERRFGHILGGPWDDLPPDHSDTLLGALQRLAGLA